MKRLSPHKFGLTFIAMALILALAVPAWGAEDPGTFRRAWDTVWLFINFGILVFFIVKFGRKPITDFITQRGSEISQSLEKAQALLEKAKAEYKESEERLAGLKQRVAELEAFQKKEAERARQRILEEAEQSSKKILAEAREVAETEIKKAWADAKAELVDMAIEEAEKMIREKIEVEDEIRIIREYVDKLSSQNQPS